jgi:hypothetical protein
VDRPPAHASSAPPPYAPSSTPSPRVYRCACCGKSKPTGVLKDWILEMSAAQQQWAHLQQKRSQTIATERAQKGRATHHAAAPSRSLCPTHARQFRTWKATPDAAHVTRSAGDDLLASIQRQQQQQQFTEEQRVLCKEWLETTDYLNNFGECASMAICLASLFAIAHLARLCARLPFCSAGSDFVNIDGPDYTALRNLLARGSNQQSGVGADDGTMANLLWTEIEQKCMEYLGGYVPISTATHVSDLLTHLACALQANIGGPAQADEAAKHPKKLGCTRFLTLPFHYYWVSESSQAVAARRRALIHFIVDTISTDASYPVGSEEQRSEALELRALQDIERWLHRTRKGVRIVLLEALMITAGGRLLHADFLQKVVAACRRAGAFVVSDEALSAVRSGHPLFCSSIPFRPDFVFLGKSLGCAMLLCNAAGEESRARAKDLQEVVLNDYSILGCAEVLLKAALTLRTFERDKVAERCAEQGPKLIAALKELVGPHVRGVGYCLWVDKNIWRLPIFFSQHGRMLPRLDQTPEAVSQLIAKSAEIMPRIAGDPSVLAYLRLSMCCVCAAAASLPDEGWTLTQCQHCTRQWHVASTKEHIDCSLQLPNGKCSCALSPSSVNPSPM